MGLVTLLTDFGTADGYVGAMKGVILRIAPTTTIVDLAHDVPRHDLAHAAWALATSTLEFPAGTIHVCVVDPGVGGARAEVIARAGDQWYVAPDNGVLAYLDVEEAWRIVRGPDVSATFHGRDVFAPAAAALASGAPPPGAPYTLVGVRPFPAGCVVHIDQYGNLITDVPCGSAGTVTIAGRALPLVATYEDVAPGDLLAYRGSAGTVEIAVRGGDASRVLGLPRGEPVTLA